MRQAVFVDRDGVLNRAVVRDGKPYPPASVDELEVLPGVPEACRMLREAGYLLIMATNQPDVARGTQSREKVEEMNRGLCAKLSLDDARVCYHDDADRCGCRKPEPGLILEAAAHWGVDRSRSFMVGDRWRDIEAGCRAGCTTVLIGAGYAEKEASDPDGRFDSFLEAARWILGKVSCLGGDCHASHA